MFVDGLTAIPLGELPTGTVVVTVLVKPFTTETELDPLFETYTVFVFGLTATDLGAVPTEIAGMLA